jgi:hypothetical protein
MGAEVYPTVRDRSGRGRYNRRVVRRVVLALAVLALFTGCNGSGNGGGSPTEPGDPTIVLSAQATVLFVGATTTLDATARQADGRPMTGAAIDVSTTVGLLSAARLTTDSQGRATVVLRGTEPGVAVVTARLAGALPAQVTIQIGQGSAILVLPAASTIDGNGETAISIRVARRDGSPTPAGTALDVSTTLGQLAETRPRTDANGVASTRLRGNGASGVAIVRAYLSGQPDFGQAEVRIGGGQRLVLHADPTVVSPQGTARVTALLTSLSGASAGAGIAVRLSTDLGRLDATDLVTDASGAVSTTFRAGGATGVAALGATANGVSAAAAITIDGRARLAVRASPPSIAPNGAAALSILATLVDGSPLPAGSRIRLVTSLGRLDAGDLVTDAAGSAATTLRGEGIRGTAHVVATADGYPGSGAVDVPIR